MVLCVCACLEKHLRRDLRLSPKLNESGLMKAQTLGDTAKDLNVRFVLLDAGKLRGGLAVVNSHFNVRDVNLLIIYFRGRN